MIVVVIAILGYIGYDYAIWFIKLIQKSYKIFKTNGFKLKKNDIEKYGLLVPLGKEICNLFNVNRSDTRMAHEIDALIHLLLVIILDTGNIEITREIILSIIYIRFFILGTHQLNVLFFDRYVNGVEKCNISSFPRIVIISIINLTEIFYSARYIGDINISVIMIGTITIMQLLASTVQLYNFNHR